MNKKVYLGILAAFLMGLSANADYQQPQGTNYIKPVNQYAKPRPKTYPSASITQDYTQNSSMPNSTPNYSSPVDSSVDNLTNRLNPINNPMNLINTLNQGL